MRLHPRSLYTRLMIALLVVLALAGSGLIVAAWFYSGVAAIGFGSSAGRGDIVRNAKFAFAEALMPWDPAVSKTPHNTFIGGASLWAMTAPHRTLARAGATRSGSRKK